MSLHFEPTIQTDAVAIRLIGPKGPVPCDSWSLAVPASMVAGADLAEELVADGAATIEGDTLLVGHGAAARLTPSRAASLGLGARADVVAQIQMKGVPGKSGYGADLVWKRPNGAGVIVSERRGAFLRIGTAWHRLPGELLEVAGAVEALDRTPADMAAQLVAMARLRSVLPDAEQAGAALVNGTIGRMTIAVADAFSLDLTGDGNATKLVPILHRAGAISDAPMLPAQAQATFGGDQFHRFGEARALYALGGDTYVVLSQPLQKALNVVRRFQNRSVALRKALFANPRLHLRAALGDDLDDALLEDLVRDTRAYSERVVGLGLWVPRVVPWITLPPTDWLNEGTTTPMPPPKGITIGERRIPLTAGACDEIADRLRTAIASGESSVQYFLDGEEIHIPAHPDVLKAVETVAASHARTAVPSPATTDAETRIAGETSHALVAVIRANEADVEFAGAISPRSGPLDGPPRLLAATLKAHQEEGLVWLQRAWTFGMPGVLLADDMGLGKTLQGLAFLAWLRESMTAHRIPRSPVLIVAPTGLLQNWRAEHDRHLSSPGLGTCVEAFGPGLRALKRGGGEDRPGLDSHALQRADWVLTTYETLRDYIVDFAAVRFAAVLLDEAQKIKNPGVRITDAAKAVKADFIVAMTGTPVENRLADLWCITDTVYPAVLGDLKTFSKTYEETQDPQTTRGLRLLLDQPRNARPALMLRRLKRDRLPDLPEQREIHYTAPMPTGQHDAYAAAVAAARESDAPGAMLQALHAFRRISLHPDVTMDVPDETFIAASARLQILFQVLDRIAADGQRALIFLEERTMQARLVGVIQRRYRLRQPPMLINGEVSGDLRQRRVDLFQSGPEGFDAMLLSPKAGGVGLTLTRANHAIHLSRWWNPAVEDQCTGRVSRIGQTRPVSVHVPLATLPDGRRSFDLNLHDLLERKRRLSADALLPAEATASDRDELFRRTVGDDGIREA